MTVHVDLIAKLGITDHIPLLFSTLLSYAIDIAIEITSLVDNVVSVGLPDLQSMRLPGPIHLQLFALLGLCCFNVEHDGTQELNYNAATYGNHLKAGALPPILIV